MSDLHDREITLRHLKGGRKNVGRRRARTARLSGFENLEGRLLLSVGYTEYSVPDAASLLHITPGPDGNLWFTVTGNNQVGAMATNGLVVKEFGSPSGITRFPADSNPTGITAGPDGALWFTEKFAKQIARMTTDGDITDVFPTSSMPNEITVGPDHKIWFTEGTDQIGVIDPTVAGGDLHEFTVHTAGSVPTDITAGPDGAVWFTESNGNQIGRIDVTSHEILEFPVPTANSQPAGITTGPDGDLWFTECLGNKIGRINPTTRVISPTNDEFPIPTANSIPRRITTGPDGALWFTEQNGQKLGQITTAGVITEGESLPGLPYGITSGPDANIWFAEDLAVGRAALPGSDLSVTMSDPSSEDPPKPVVVGENFALTIPVTNSGPDPATGVTLTTTLPDGFELVPELSQGSTVVNGKVITNVGDMAAGNFGGSTTEFINLIITPTKAGTFTSSTIVSSSSPEKYPPNDTASVTTTVLAGIPDLSISMHAAPANTALVGDDLVYTITVTNNGTDTAADAKILDTLPSGVALVSSTKPFSSNTIDLGPMDPQTSQTVSITVHPTAVGSLTNSASVTAGSPELNLDDNSASVTNTVVQPSDLALTVHASKDTVNVGDSFTYTITVKNNGSGDANGVKLSDALPSGIQFVSSDFTFTNGVADLGKMIPGATTIVTIAAKAINAGTFTYNMSVTSDPDSSHDTTPVTTTVLPIGADVSVAMSVSSSTPAVGDTITYTIPVNNNGSIGSDGVVLTDKLPVGVSFVSADPAAYVHFTPASNPGVNGPGTVTVNLGAIDSHATLNVKVMVKVLQAGTITNKASITSSTPDYSSSNNATPPVSVASYYAPVSLQMGGDVDLLKANKNQLVTFAWTVTNPPTGGHAATGLVAVVTAPSGFKINGASMTVGTGSAKVDGQTVTYSIKDLAPGATMRFVVQGSSDNVGAYALTAVLGSRNPIVGGGPIVSTVQSQIISGLTNHLVYPDKGGGPILQNVSVDTLFLGKQWDDNSTADQLRDASGKLGDFLRTIVNGPYMDFLSSQYSTHGQTIGRGSVNAGEVLENTPPAAMTDAQIQALVQQEILDGRLPNQSNRLYFVFTPPGTVVSSGGLDSAKNFYGYHSWFSYFTDAKKTKTARAYYVVMPWEDGSGTNARKLNLSTFNSMTNVASHELAEAVTDPGSPVGWTDPTAPSPNEIGDLANLKNLATEPEGGEGDYGRLDNYVVQYEWANDYTYPGTNQRVIDDVALPAEKVNPNGTPGVGFAILRVLALTSSGTAHSSAHAKSIPMAAAAPSFTFSGPIATFSDTEDHGTDPSIYSVSIDWGDQTSSAGTVTYDANLDQFIISGSHTFAQAAGSEVVLSIQVTNNATGAVAGRQVKVALQSSTAPPAQIGFNSATYAVARNGSQAAITVTRAGDSSVESTVDFHVGGGSAVSGVDYQAVAGTLVFEPGQSSQTFTIPIYADPAITTDQTLSLTLSFATGNATLASQATAVLTIHPSTDIFAPSAPQLTRATDSGASLIDGLTANTGSAASPLTFEVNGVSMPNGFVQLFDVTDPSNPVAVGARTQATGTTATITLSGTPIGDGTRQYAAAVSATAGSTMSPLSLPISITIDTKAPTSQVSPLPAVTGSTTITVHWSGTDTAGGSGVATYDVFVSDNGGDFTPIVEGTSDTSVNFQGDAGHTYRFYSVATDLAGNVQATPASPQASTTITLATKPGKPSAPVLAPQSDTGISDHDGLTNNNGSASAPLVFKVTESPSQNDFFRLFDVTNPAKPVLLAGPVQADNGTVTVAGGVLVDGTHKIAATTALSATGAQSALSAATSITIQTALHVVSITPGVGNFSALPGNHIVVTFNHPIVGLKPGDLSGAGVASNPFAVYFTARGPDGAFLAPSGLDSGSLPMHATVVYRLTANGGSSITLTPRVPLGTDVYVIAIGGGLTDLAGNRLTDAHGKKGTEFSTFEIKVKSTDTTPLNVVSVTTQQGSVPINPGATIAQPDTIAIRFNKPVNFLTTNTDTVQLLAGPSQTPVFSAVAYSPSTQTVYVTPESILVPGTTYTIQVSGTVTGDQRFPNPDTRFALGTTFTRSFKVNADHVTGHAPFVITSSGGILQITPGPGTRSTALGYGSINLSERLDLSKVARFAVKLVPQHGGLNDNGFDSADTPVNARLAFNPNTNQLIVVPTVPLGNDGYLYVITKLTATNGDLLTNPGGALPIYSGFTLRAGAKSRTSAAHTGADRAPATAAAAIGHPAANTSPGAASPSVQSVGSTPTENHASSPRRRPAQDLITRIHGPAGPLSLLLKSHAGRHIKRG